MAEVRGVMEPGLGKNANDRMLFFINTPENPEKLINLRVSMKEWSLGSHFSKYRTDTPHINGS